MPLIQQDTLRDLTFRIFQATGIPVDDARIIDVLTVAMPGSQQAHVQAVERVLAARRLGGPKREAAPYHL